MFIHLRFRDGNEFREEVLIFHREAIKVKFYDTQTRRLENPRILITRVRKNNQANPKIKEMWIILIHMIHILLEAGHKRGTRLYLLF